MWTSLHQKVRQRALNIACVCFVMAFLANSRSQAQTVGVVILDPLNAMLDWFTRKESWRQGSEIWYCSCSYDMTHGTSVASYRTKRAMYPEASNLLAHMQCWVNSLRSRHFMGQESCCQMCALQKAAIWCVVSGDVPPETPESEVKIISSDDESDGFPDLAARIADLTNRLEEKNESRHAQSGVRNIEDPGECFIPSGRDSPGNAAFSEDVPLADIVAKISPQVHSYFESLHHSPSSAVVRGTPESVLPFTSCLRHIFLSIVQHIFLSMHTASAHSCNLLRWRSRQVWYCAIGL